MKTLRVMWPAAFILLAGACSGSTTPPSPPPPAAWAIGLVSDSLTPASRLYGSPTWAFYIVLIGGPVESGFLAKGTLGRDSVGRFAHCLKPAGQFLGHGEVDFIAIGDTLSSDSAAYWRNVNRLDQGGEPMRLLFVSLARRDSQAVLPGLVILASPSFVPTAVSAPARGSARENPILLHWAWRDGGSTFAQDTTHASLAACGVN